MAADLPFIDEFEAMVAAPPEAVFLAASRRVARSFAAPAGRAFAAVLGCVPRGDTFTSPPQEGQEAIGFRVAKVDQPGLLVLEGRHRFAAYRLSLLIDASGHDQSRLRVRTDAAFPGFKGALYRALVIGSGAHAFVVRRVLDAIARQAVRPRPRGQVSTINP